MRIIKLELTNFGRFHHKTIQMDSGCNLIYGANESGKTTIHTFIYGMFFGLDPSRGRGAKNSLYIRYLPWDTPGQYDGKLWFERGGCVYRIERCFLREQRSLYLLDETHGIELEPAAEQLASLLAPLNEILFRNTLLIRQMQTVPDEELAPQLENFAANLNLSRSAAVDISSARDSLNEKKRALRRTLHPNALSEKMRLETERSRELTSQKDLAGQLLAQDQKLASLEEQIRNRKQTLQEAAAAAQKKETAPSPDPLPKPFPHMPAVLCYFFCLLCVTACGSLLITSRFPDLLPAALCSAWIFLLLGLLFEWIRARRRRLIARLSAPNQTPESPAADPSPVPDTPDGNPESDPQLAALTEERELQVREQIRLQLRLSQSRERLYQIETSIGSLDRQLAQDAEAETERKALDLALTRLEQLSGQVQHSYGIHLNAAASRLLTALTRGRYSNLKLSEDLHITVNDGQKIIRAEQLSRGTLEQVYFCLRIAAAQMISPEEAFPFLLDDVFAFYDEDRLRAALQVLSELHTQVILFSCHTREQQLMKEYQAESVC